VATPAEIADGLTRTLALAGKANAEPALPPAVYPSVASFAAYVVGALGWRERVSLLLSPSDLSPLLGSTRLRGGAESGVAEAAYLIKEGLLPPRLAPGDDLLAPVTRALLYRVMHRILARYEAFDLREAIFRGSRSENLLLVPARTELAGLAAAVEIEPAAGVILARGDGTDAVLVEEITLTPGDRLHYILRDGRAAYIRQRANVRGASDDRFTVNYQWEVRYTREELEEKIRTRASIGRLVDVQPTERGVSGRVKELRVVGTAGRFTFRGFSIRTLLGIRENLFVVDRQRDADGTVRAFVFSGKGWGHGVGLCQVGAFGMALRGATYVEILERYYTGVSIEPLVWE
jgi:stage II sporulation protein D